MLLLRQELQHASGIGAVGTLAGFVFALLNSDTGSYMVAFMVLGGIVMVGGVRLLIYGRLTPSRMAQLAGLPA